MGWPLLAAGHRLSTNIRAWASEPVRSFVGGYEPVQLQMQNIAQDSGKHRAAVALSSAIA